MIHFARQHISEHRTAVYRLNCLMVDRYLLPCLHIGQRIDIGIIDSAVFPDFRRAVLFRFEQIFKISVFSILYCSSLCHQNFPLVDLFLDYRGKIGLMQSFYNAL